jgi:hypothetical protein
MILPWPRMRPSAERWDHPRLFRERAWLSERFCRVSDYLLAEDFVPEQEQTSCRALDCGEQILQRGFKSSAVDASGGCSVGRLSETIEMRE